MSALPTVDLRARLADLVVGALLRRRVAMRVESCKLAAVSEGRQTESARRLGYRPQPRDRRGRLLGRAWLVAAESYSERDAAWFRAPLFG